MSRYHFLSWSSHIFYSLTFVAWFILFACKLMVTMITPLICFLGGIDSHLLQRTCNKRARKRLGVIILSSIRIPTSQPPFNHFPLGYSRILLFLSFEKTLTQLIQGTGWTTRHSLPTWLVHQLALVEVHLSLVERDKSESNHTSIHFISSTSPCSNFRKHEV